MTTSVPIMTGITDQGSSSETTDPIYTITTEFNELTTEYTTELTDLTTKYTGFSTDFTQSEYTTFSTELTTWETTSDVTMATTEDAMTTEEIASTTTRFVRRYPCVCGDPPAVSNGAVTYTGSYINQTRAEYNCDEGYTNSGGSSLVCFVSDDTDCSNSWVTDPDDPTSGTPNCEFEIGVTDVITNNTFNEEGNDTELWVLIGVALFILLLLLLGLLLLCWWFCCRECCRRCCIRSCPCCRQCCYEIPYARGVHPHQVRPAQNGVIYDDPGYHSNKQVRTVRVVPEPHYNNSSHQTSTPVIHRREVVHPVAESNPQTTYRSVEVSPAEITPETYRKRYGYYPRGYASPSNVDFRSDTMSDNGMGPRPKEFVRMNDSKMELPQYASGFEPKHFVHSNSERMQVPQGKPVNSHGQPVWMPHSNNVRSNLKTSTK